MRPTPNLPPLIPRAERRLREYQQGERVVVEYARSAPRARETHRIGTIETCPAPGHRYYLVLFDDNPGFKRDSIAVEQIAALLPLSMDRDDVEAWLDDER